MLDRTYKGPTELHGIGGPKLAGAPGDPHGDDHQGPARAEPAVGSRAGRASSSPSWRSWPARTRCPGRSAPTCRVSTTAPIWIGGMLKYLVDNWPTEEGGHRRRGVGALLRDALRDRARGGRIARRRPHRVRRVLRRLRSAHASPNPTLLEKLDLGEKFFPDLKNGLVSGGILCAIVFAILCVLLLNNARKRLEDGRRVAKRSRRPSS